MRFSREVVSVFTTLGAVSLSVSILLLFFYNIFSWLFLSPIIPLLLPIAIIGFLLFSLGAVYWTIFLINERGFMKLVTSYPIVETKTDMSNLEMLLPAYLIDSIDREILEFVSSNSGDILAIKMQIENKSFSHDTKQIAQRISNLIDLKMIGVYDRRLKRRLTITSLGHEAINTPPATFSSKIPFIVRNHMYEAYRQLWLEKWGQVINEAHKSIESAYKILLKNQTNEEILKILDEKNKSRPLEQRTAGALHNIMIEIKQLKTGTFERYLSDQITKLKGIAHDSPDSKTYTPEHAVRTVQYLGILLRILFSA